MLIDGYDQYNQQDNEVVNISPDDASEEPADALPRADDCKSGSLLPPPPLNRIPRLTAVLSRHHETSCPRRFARCRDRSRNISYLAYRKVADIVQKRARASL